MGTFSYRFARLLCSHTQASSRDELYSVAQKDCALLLFALYYLMLWRLYATVLLKSRQCCYLTVLNCSINLFT